MIQPVHWLVEVVSVLARICPKTCESDAILLSAFEFEVLDSLEVMQRACRLSKEINHHLFDTLYHAVALELGGNFITADIKYWNKAHTQGHIFTLEQWSNQT